jgi:hypothetical protein
MVVPEEDMNDGISGGVLTAFFTRSPKPFSARFAAFPFLCGCSSHSLFPLVRLLGTVTSARLRDMAWTTLSAAQTAPCGRVIFYVAAEPAPISHLPCT